MYDNGYRKFDARGRICIPKHIREVYELENAVVDIFTENDLVIIRKVTDNPDRDSPGRTSAFGLFHRRGTSHCNFCICSSCNAFRCPWAGVFKRLDTSGLYKSRCEKCGCSDIEPIHDCDFYTQRKRKRFYVFKPKKRITNHGLIMRGLRELKELLTAKQPESPPKTPLISRWALEQLRENEKEDL
jgi:hypothetical protein